MSTATYNYAAIYNYEVKAKCNSGQCSFYATQAVKDAFQQSVLDELRGKMATQAQAQFTAGLAKETGHWFNIGAVTTEFTVTTTRGDIEFITPFQWDYGIYFDIQCKTTVPFQTDISNPKAMQSPQLEAVVTSIITTILALIIAQPALFLILVIVVAVIAGAAYLQSQGGLATLIGGPGLAGQITTIVIAGVIGITALLLLTTSFGQRATRKGYQTAKRAYRRVRRR